MRTPLYPLLFEPVYKDYLWGGDRISKRYGRRTGHRTCAESWEIADRPEGMSRVINGSLRGRTLHELVARLGARLLGSAGVARARASGDRAFPLLVKLIDASQRLSLQVHPDDRRAHRVGGQPKTEMWYILGAEPGSQIFAGLRPGTGPAEFHEAIAQGTVLRLVYAMPALPGRAFYIPGGRIHAIGEGCLLLEIQQNSHTTYRVHDWGRVDRDGRPRELHLDKAIPVINWKDRPAHPIRPVQVRRSRTGNTYDRIVRSGHFHVMRLRLRSPEPVANGGRSFHAYFVESGRVRAEANGFSADLAPGQSVLLPAAVARYRLSPLAGGAVLIRATL